MSEKPKSVKELFDALPVRYFLDVDIADWPEEEKVLLKGRLDAINEERKRENEIRDMYKECMLLDSLHFHRNVPLAFTPWSPTSMFAHSWLQREQEIVTIPVDMDLTGLPSLCNVYMVQTTSSPDVANVTKGKKRRKRRGHGGMR